MVADRLRQPFRLEVATWTLIAVAAGLALGGCTAKKTPQEGSQAGDPIADGQRIFRFDTFGDEQFWTDKFWLHNVVDTDPATTVALLKMNAVVGLKAEVDANNLSFERR